MFWEIFSNMILPINILIMSVGVSVGIMIGALPGLNTILAITVLLPFTFGMDSVTGMYLLLGASCGGLFGGSISAILINTPGTPAACATMIDGYPMAKNGRAGDALRCALIGSTCGGLLSAVALLFFAPLIAKVALNFASPEFFALCIFGMSTVIGICGDDALKGIIMAALGLLISTVGIDIIDGTQRFMFGNLNLLSGINSIVVMLGVFAMSEVLDKTRNRFSNAEIKETTMEYRKATIKIRDILRRRKLIIKSSVIGIIIGAIPGTGGALAAMLSYDQAKRSSKHPEEFGKGSEEGVIAPETGNNAVSAATLIPMLTLGIPGDASAAVLLGALTMQGITPGAALFTEDRVWVYAIMGGLFLINIIMLIEGWVFSRAFVSVTRIPEVILLPCIVVLCFVGAFAIANNLFNVLLMLIFGLVGFYLRRLNFPTPPLVIALVLGATLEQNLRRSLILSKGGYSIFFTRPISCCILIVAILSLFYPTLKRLIAKRRDKKCT